jgi:hypothetical protein
MSRILFCFDFDLTLTKSHLFQYVAHEIAMGLTRESALLKASTLIRTGGVRNGSALWETIAMLLTAGHGLVITSFTAFPELPFALLQGGVKEVRALGSGRQETRWLSRALVIYGDPAPHLCPSYPPAGSIYLRHSEGGDGSEGKCPHIRRALDILEARGELFDQVLLVDDSEFNIDRALEAGYEAIHVPESVEDMTHLKEIHERVMRDL